MGCACSTKHLIEPLSVLIPESLTPSLELNYAQLGKIQSSVADKSLFTVREENSLLEESSNLSPLSELPVSSASTNSFN